MTTTPSKNWKQILLRLNFVYRIASISACSKKKTSFDETLCFNIFNIFFPKIVLTKQGVNFTNMFTNSFCARRSRKRKMTDNLTIIFMLSGSAWVKATRRMLMKLTQGGLILLRSIQMNLKTVRRWLKSY